jgi:hypothetical protein
MRGGYDYRLTMDFLMLCLCGHTFEMHDQLEGCAQCACDRDRDRCLDAAIDIARSERTPYPPRVGSESNSLPTLTNSV